MANLKAFRKASKPRACENYEDEELGREVANVGHERVRCPLPAQCINMLCLIMRERPYFDKEMGRIFSGGKRKNAGCFRTPRFESFASPA